MEMTLKIYWARYERSDDGIVGTVDETTLFIPADEVRVHARIDVGDRENAMKHWHAQSDGPGYLNYLSHSADGEHPGRLICVIYDGVEAWYTASHAWLLGPSGATIERIAP